MEEVLLYLFRVSAGTAAFYLLYLLLFSKRKQFRFNRMYLLGSFLLSSFIPLITVTITRQATAQVVLLPAATETLNPVEASEGAAISLHVILLLLYGTGVVVFLVHLIIGHLRVWQISRKSRPGTSRGISYFITPEDVHPFTFFRRIVVPGESTLQHYLPMILRHEKIHADGRHTMDILLSELLFLFQWFNPFAWLMKNAIKNNLEYLTDEEVILEADSYAYQLALVALTGKKEMTPFLNALNGNDLKNRIIMMKQKTENRNSVIRKMMVIPLVILLIAGLSNKEFKAAPLSDGGLTNFPTLQAVNELTSPDTLKKSKTNEVIVVGYPANSANSGASNKTEKSGEAISIRKSSGMNPAFRETGSETGGGTGKNEITVIGYGMKTEGVNFTGDSVKVRMISKDPGKQPLYILDGCEVESIDDISPDQIESISVLKDASSVAIYGEKGKNGVIVITSKNAGKPVSDPLVIINGKETTLKISDVEVEDIQSINVLKGKSATDKYGVKGEKGVIEITLKKYTEEISSAITTVDQLRRRVAQNIRYPVKAQENGEQSLVKVYAFVNGEGAITEITTSTPASGFQKIDEVVVVGYGPSSVSLKQVEYSTSLVQEASLQIKKLPDLAIEQFKNRWVEFQFKFMLQK